MSSATPATAFPVLWRDTQAGRAEAWIRDGIRVRREMKLDFHDAQEALGARRAARAMNEEYFEDQGQFCPNHAHDAR